MTIWKINDDCPKQIDATDLIKESKIEENLENWIEKDPTILGEELFIIGRQKIFSDTKDRLDLIALDLQGNAVIIELKRGKLKDPVHMQAFQYASYISNWELKDFEILARDYFNDAEINLIQKFEEFCDEKGGIDELPEINSNQRVILAGTEVSDRLGSVCHWLSQQNLDIKLIKVEVFKNNNELIIKPVVLLPQEENPFCNIGSHKNTKGRETGKYDKEWHLERRCSKESRPVLLNICSIIADLFTDIEGPLWGQKHYVAFQYKSFTWLRVNTNSKTLRLSFNVHTGIFNKQKIATELGVEFFNTDASLSEKLGLPSNINVLNKNKTTDRIILRIREDFDLDSESFINFLQDMHKYCVKKDTNIKKVA